MLLHFVIYAANADFELMLLYFVIYAAKLCKSGITLDPCERLGEVQ